jgi:hypothetical protein
MKSELSEFAEELGVDARLYGEVSEDELAALYSNSDVFLCLSEHEGFGLPVFEAMACQIPIITWATTAFSDLLAGHPFAFPEYDLNMFTAAILSLSDPRIREKVLEQQKQILDRYDAAVVEEQLRNALMKSQDDHLSANLIASFPESLRANCSFAKEIANFAQSSRQHPISVVKHDSGNNLYSLYDLSIYRRFIDMQYLERRQLLQPALADLSVTFDAHEFSTVDGKSDEDGIHVAFDANSRHHMVFGPYIQFPKGDFTVEFLVVPETEQNVSAMADVATEGRTIANKLLKIKRNTDDNHVLDFTVAEEGTIVEFRLSPREDRNGSISFRGVNVRRRR